MSQLYARSEAGNNGGTIMDAIAQIPMSMVHAARPSSKAGPLSFSDRMVRRVLMPIVILIGLYGLVHYVFHGKSEMGIPGYQVEQPVVLPE